MQMQFSPVSRMPIIVSDPFDAEFESDPEPESISKSVCNFRKSHERVVWSCKTGSGNTDTTPGFLAIDWASSSDKRAAKPEKPCL